MAEMITVLEEAISDVGYWRWWDEDLPGSFQVEFGGTQLWYPPEAEDKPPSGVMSLEFYTPCLIAFLTGRGASDIPPDWPEALHEDRLKPFTITHETFALNRPDTASGLLATMEARFHVGGPDDARPASASACLSFRAGPVGLVVCGASMGVYNWDGGMSPEQVIEANERWWEYWREYWRRADSDHPMPQDYACEVTIPSSKFSLSEIVPRRKGRRRR